MDTKQIGSMSAAKHTPGLLVRLHWPTWAGRWLAGPIRLQTQKEQRAAIAKATGAAS